MYSEALVIKLNAIAHQYKDIIQRQLNALFNQPKYKNTGESAASVHVEVIAGDTKKAPQIAINFKDSLNILDKRKVQWTKQPPIKELLAWTSTKKNFSSVPGYKNGEHTNLPPWKVEQRIAWAIAMSQKKFDRWKPKPWRKKSLSAVLKEMNELIVDSFAKAIDQEIQKSINAGVAATNG